MFSSAIQAGMDMDRYVLGIEDGPGYENEEFADQVPNLLVVRVMRARGLVAMDTSLAGGEDTSDPFVKLTCDGVQHR